jgi:hypothetical protein
VARIQSLAAPDTVAISADLATGAEVDRPYQLVLLVEACGIGGQQEAGLPVLAETLTE